MTLHDIVIKTRECLRPYLIIETFPTGTKSRVHSAVEGIIQDALRESACEAGWPAAQRGTTPPEGLREALRRIPESVFALYLDPPQRELIRAALAATQRAPVEQGRETPKPPSINANQTAAEQFHEDILSIYGARSQTALRVTCREIFERREREVLKAAAPDHAREGALPSDEQAATDFLYGTHEKPTVAQVMILIRDIRKQSNAALNEAEIFIRGNRLVRPSQDETGRVGDIVRRALVDGKEGGE